MAESLTMIFFFFFYEQNWPKNEILTHAMKIFGYTVVSVLFSNDYSVNYLL